MNSRITACICALTAAALFGAQFPLSKSLLDRQINPVFLAGLCYTIPAILFMAFRLARPAPLERRLQKTDWKWLIGAALAGGMAAPLLLMVGQSRIPSHLSAILAPSEVLFTTLIAVLIFKERLSSWELLAVLFIVAGGSAVGFGAEGSSSASLTGTLLVGLALVIGSYAMWGWDNNFTARIAGRDPLNISIVKQMAGGLVNIAIGLSLGVSFSISMNDFLLIAIIGLCCYGLSFVLFIYAIRVLQASRATALFGINPVIGVLLAWVLRKEEPSVAALIGGVIMMGGMYFLILKPQPKPEVTNP